MDVGGLIRGGDRIAAEGLVRFWCWERRWEERVGEMEGQRGMKEERREVEGRGEENKGKRGGEEVEIGGKGKREGQRDWERDGFREVKEEEEEEGRRRGKGKESEKQRERERETG